MNLNLINHSRVGIEVALSPDTASRIFGPEHIADLVGKPRDPCTHDTLTYQVCHDGARYPASCVVQRIGDQSNRQVVQTPADPSLPEATQTQPAIVIPTRPAE